MAVCIKTTYSGTGLAVGFSLLAKLEEWFAAHQDVLLSIPASSQTNEITTGILMAYKPTSF